MNLNPHLPEERDLPASHMQARQEHLVSEIARDIEQSGAGRLGRVRVWAERLPGRHPWMGWSRLRRPVVGAGGLLGTAAVVLIVLGAAGVFGAGGARIADHVAAILPDEKVDGYVALVPRVLRSGERASFGVSLLKGERPVSGTVRVAVLRKTTLVAEGKARIVGKGTVQVQVPRVAPGEYQVTVQGAGFSDSAAVQVQEGTLVFLETDKPIYKPGQTIQMRVLAMDSELKPVPTEATVEVQDAKAIKVFKRTVQTDEFGMTTLELPLSQEPNLGVWKLKATAGGSSNELDVRVEEYVLPKYGVTVDLAKEWFLVDEPISGHVKAEYSFGRPVSGELRVKASRYVGQWQEFATFTAPIDGEGDFRLDPAQYVAGVPEAGGQGNVTLDVSVVEKSTGYEEKSTELVTVAAAPVNIRLIPEGSAFKPGLPFGFLVVTETPDGQPVEAAVALETTFFDENYNEVGRDSRRVETSRGTALLRLLAPDERRPHVGPGDVGSRRGVQGDHRRLLALGQLRVRGAAGGGRPLRRRHGEVPRRVHERGHHLLLRGGLAGPRDLQRQRRAGHLDPGHPGHGPVGPPPGLPDPAQQRGGRRQPALRGRG